MSEADENGWMPIETAPKEKDVLIIRREALRTYPIHIAMLIDGGWYEEAFPIKRLPDPTHWQPLPKPPKPPVQP